MKTQPIIDAYNSKQRAERHIKRVKKEVDSVFKKKRKLIEDLRESDDFQEHERLENELEKVKDEVHSLNDDLKKAEKALKDSENRYSEAQNEFRKEYTKWADKRWQKLKAIAKQADDLNDELTEVAEVAHRYANLPAIKAPGNFRRQLTGRIDVRFTPEKRLQKLKKAV